MRLAGSVLIEPSAVALVARLLEAERHRQLQVNGARLVEPLQRLLADLVEELKSLPLPTVSWVPARVAAARLDVKPQTVRNMIRDGRLVGRREGRLWVVEEASVAARTSLRSATYAKLDRRGETPIHPPIKQISHRASAQPGISGVFDELATSSGRVSSRTVDGLPRPPFTTAVAIHTEIDTQFPRV